MRQSHVYSIARRVALVVGAGCALIVASSCEENIPSGPNTFPATLRIRLASDTTIIGATRSADAEAVDTAGHVIKALTFAWSTGDTNVLGFSNPASPSEDVSAGRTTTILGRRAGRTTLTLTLPDSRFAVSPATRTQTIVVGGVRILSTHDSTLTAINDTAVAIAAGLTMVNGTLTTRPSQGIRWIHLGSRTTIAGQGDTVRYIARANGADTLIATHDFCLAGAKCADTLVVRVSQRLFLTVAPKSFLSWSFADTLAPTVTLADRRGTGQAGTTIRFIPITAADSAVVRVAPPVGSSNPTNGLMATPQLVSQGNGAANVRVVALAPDGFTILGTDSVTETVRQVARRVAVEPLRAVMTETDSIPILPIARDARGAGIADAGVTIASSELPLHNGWAGPRSDITADVVATITPELTSGPALPQNNPLAPQVAVVFDPASITVAKLDTVKAGSAEKTRTVSTAVYDTTGLPAFAAFVRVRVTGGTAPDFVQVTGNGNASVTWVLPDIAGNYTLTGVRTSSALSTLADSAGRIVMRRSYVVVASDPVASTSTLGVSATTVAAGQTATVTVTIKDAFGNVVKTATTADFTASTTPARGTIGSFTCNLGICTATYTAPATAGPDVISVKVGGTDIQGSPITITIP